MCVPIQVMTHTGDVCTYTGDVCTHTGDDPYR